MIRPLPAFAFPLLLVGLAGCDTEIGGRTGGPVMNEAQESVDALNPPPTAADSAGSAGEVKQPGTNEIDPAAADARPEDGRHQGQGDLTQRAADQKGTHVGQRTKEILNVKELANDPNWTVVASDPSQVQGFTAPGTAYNRAAALGGTADVEQWVKQEHALNGTFPTYQAVMDYVRQNPPNMPALREYQHYGYDDSNGQVVILENQQEKADRRRELGLPADQ